MPDEEIDALQDLGRQFHFDTALNLQPDGENNPRLSPEIIEFINSTIEEVI